MSFLVLTLTVCRLEQLSTELNVCFGVILHDLKGALDLRRYDNIPA